MSNVDNQLSAKREVDSMSATLTTAAIAAALRPLAQELASALKSVIGRFHLKLKSEALAKTLLSRVQWLNEVKTLLCLESPISLTEFYSAQHVYLPDGSRVKIETARDFREFNRCVVSGTAGQGKSILFRYLALQEILQHRLPIFVELRNLANFRDINELIQNELQNLGFDKHDEVFALLLHRPETTVFLDAFDEIPPNLQSKARKDIEDLTRRYPESTILVSSRPALNIESSPCFRVARISYLQNGEAINALKRMCRDSDDPSTVESEVKKSNHELSQLLDTPLMVALLLLHYRLTQKFPETEQAFFRDLFDVLLRRHDQTKGYVRQRYSDATETELSDVFCYLSFCTRKLGEVELPRTRLIELGREAIKFAGHDLDPAGAVDDIVHGTNLILEEGHTCR